MNEYLKKIPGTILWVAPFYNRSGYGVLARSTVSALHRNGIPVRILSVNEIEPGVDDVDMNLIKSLENTPVIPPVTVIISHVPSKSWFNLEIPEPKLRIIATTFDSAADGNLPPQEWMEVFQKMDQIWLQSYKERDVYISAGIPPEKIHIVHYPDSWKDNPYLPPVKAEQLGNKPFRFLSISMFQPRRRWDTLVEAFLEEFKHNENVELYLKVNYPSWHPIPGKPKKDLFELVNSLRLKTKSLTPIIIDDELGTRKGIVDLIDSCNVYVSTDTVSTGPVTEARVRHRLVIIPYGIMIIPKDYFIGIEVDPEAKSPLTKEMLLYQPNHKNSYMPLLKVSDVRKSLREAFNLSPEERLIKCKASADMIFGAKESLPMIINAIDVGWEYKKMQENKNLKIIWEGSQFVYHSFAHTNREITSRLIKRGRNISLCIFEKDQFIPSKADSTFINREYYNKFDEAEITVRHHWPPNLQAPKSGYWISFQPWEFGSLPKEWVKAFKKQVDEMWVPSNYVRQVYIDSGISSDRVFIIPNGIDADKFNFSSKQYKLKTKKKFKFLFIGGTIYRKGIDILLTAYSEAFTSNDDVCLVIKDMGGNSFYKGQTAGKIISDIRKKFKSPEIEYIEKNLDEKDLIGLYISCNVLVHPYRGEGFGMPVLEAMACGLPVIVTNGGSTDDFCLNEFSLKIKSERIYFDSNKVDNMETEDKPWLLNPDKNDLIEKMKFGYKNPKSLKEMGLKAAAFASENYSWEKITDLIEIRLKGIVQKEILRFSIPDSLSVFKYHIDEMTKNIEKQKLNEALDNILSAIEIFKEIENKNSIDITYPKLLTLAGNIYLVDNNFGKAEDIFRKVLAIDSNSDDAYFGLGQMYFKSERLDEAEKMLTKVLQINPEHSDAKAGLSEIENLINVWKNEENQDDDYNQLIRAEEFIEQKQLDKAKSILEILIKKNTENIDALIDLGVVLILKKEYSASKIIYKKVLNIEPANSIAEENLKFLDNQLKLS